MDITTLQKRLDSLQAELDLTKSEMQALQAKPQPFKPGDLVVRTDWCVDDTVTGGNVYRVRGLKWDGIVLSFKDDGSFNHGVYGPSLFRKADFVADRAKIEEYLLKEAGYKGFKVGKWIRFGEHQAPHVITSIKVAFDHDDPNISPAVSGCMHDDQPVAYVVDDFRGAIAIDNPSLVLLKEEPIAITVDGTSYTADFSKDGVVVFGCAQIDRWHIRHAYDWLRAEREKPSVGNRAVEAVQIGKGLFTLEILTQLVERMDNPRFE